MRSAITSTPPAAAWLCLAAATPRCSPRCVGRRPASRASPARPGAHAAVAQQCARAQYSATRDPANPLDLASAPGANPLTGAHFFVDGPAHGAAAGAIASLLGINPASLPDTESWASFDAVAQLAAPSRSRLASDPGLAHQVRELAKIAAQPEVQRLSAFSRGRRTRSESSCRPRSCSARTSPPTPTRSRSSTRTSCIPPPGCARRRARSDAAVPAFQRRVNELADAIDRRPVVLLLETDAIGTSKLHPAGGVAADLGVDAPLRDRNAGHAAPRGHLHRGRLLGLQLAGLHGAGAQRDRRRQDPRLLHQRHAPAVDDQRGALGDQGLAA